MWQDIIFFIMSVRLIRLNVCLHGTAGLLLPFFITFCLEPPGPIQVQQTGEHFPL